MDGFERRTDEKRKRIFEAAQGLFGRHGFKRVSIEEVAEQAGVSKVTIYNYFGSKEGLIRELVAAAFRSRKVAIERLVHGDLPFPEKLRSLVLQKAEASSSYSQEFLERILQHPAWQQQPVEELDGLVAELMEQGKREGIISDKTPLRALRLYIEIFKSGTEAQSTVLAGLTSEELSQIIRMFFHGLTAT